MKMGFVTAILGAYDFDQMMDTAGRMGFKCAEVACWPFEKAERRYAGVSHIDTESLDAEVIKHIKTKCKETGIEISSLAYYPNTLDEDMKKRERIIRHLYSVIDASAALGVNLVTTFIGRMQHKTIEENLEEMVHVWIPILQHADTKGVKIGIENCPMLFDADQWPGGQNLFCTPAIWRKVFALLPSKNLGINYDPSHFVWQHIDYIKPLYEFKDRILHVHFKDIKLLPEKLNDLGVLAYPLSYMAPKLPGLGDVDWSKFVSALTDIGYDGYACIEVEDKSFEDSRQKIEESLVLSKRYLEQYVI